ncbi:MAG: oligosaccharide flippase family protein, partial [Candidatus Woesearchaeota archaeon]
MTDEKHLNALKELLHGAGISFLLGMIGYILMFFFRIIAANYFGPSEFGLYEMAMTILGIVVIFSDLGIKSGIQRYIPYYLEKKESTLLRGYLKFIIVLPLLFSIIVSISLYILAEKITLFFGFDNSFTLFVKIISFSIIFKILYEIFIHILVSYKQIYKAVVSYNIVERTILLVGIILIVYYKLSLFSLMVLTLFSSIISFLLAGYFVSKLQFKIKGKAKYEINDWLKFSFPLIFTGVLAYLLNWSDNFIIGKYLTATEVGIYGIAYSLANYLNFIPGAFLGLFLPIVT